MGRGGLNKKTPDIILKLGQRRRRWANIKMTSAQRLVCFGIWLKPV